MSSIDGRTATLFVVLAGVGVTLRAKSAAATGNPTKLRQVRTRLLRCGAFSLAAALGVSGIWRKVARHGPLEWLMRKACDP